MKPFKTAWAPVALALFALPLATACSSDDEEEPSNKRRTISVVVSENPMQNESADARSTRADITTSESFSSFKMIYQADAETNTTYTATKKAVRLQDGEFSPILGLHWNMASKLISMPTTATARLYTTAAIPTSHSRWVSSQII